MSKFKPLTGGMPRLLGLHQGHLAARYRALYRGLVAKFGQPDTDSAEAMLMGMAAKAMAEAEAAGAEVSSARRALGKAIKAQVAADARFTSAMSALTAACPVVTLTPEEEVRRSFAAGLARGWAPPLKPGGLRGA